jgi:Enterobacter phage Enc34, ssDNA-binding protein
MAGRLITPEALLSYPALFAAKPTPSGELKYSCALVFPEGVDLSELKKAALAALQARWGVKTREMLQRKELKWPFRDGAEKDGPGYGPGKTFINVTSRQRPGIVDRHAGPDGRPRQITDPAEIYPGCFVRASLRPFTYDVNGSKGVSFGLQNVQKLRDGERIDGRMRPEDEFEAIEGGGADLDDLLA